MENKYYMTFLNNDQKQTLLNIKNGKSNMKIRSFPCIAKNKNHGLFGNRYRRWESWEDEFIIDMKNIGVSIPIIAKSILRTTDATYTRCRKLSIINNTYNKDHLEDKYKSNEEFYKSLGEVNSILDAYSGISSYWMKYTKPDSLVITNDLNENIEAMFHKPAEKLVKQFKKLGAKFDIVDLDPFGSAYECFDDAIMICKKGLIMTFGDRIGVMSNKNLPLERYNCKKYDEETIIEYFILKAKEKGINLTTTIHKHWKQTWRVYFKINN